MRPLAEARVSSDIRFTARFQYGGLFTPCDCKATRPPTANEVLIHEMYELGIDTAFRVNETAVV